MHTYSILVGDENEGLGQGNRGTALRKPCMTDSSMAVFPSPGKCIKGRRQVTRGAGDVMDGICGECVRRKAEGEALGRGFLAQSRNGFAVSLSWKWVLG